MSIAKSTQTTFLLKPRLGNPNLSVILLQQAMPTEMRVHEESSGLFVDVTSSKPEDSRTQYLVDRELDRIYFLTSIRYDAEMVTRRVMASRRVSWTRQTQLPVTIKPMKWTYERALQFKFWALAAEIRDPAARVLLLFQIIELQYPTPSAYPPYIDSNLPPHPLTEAKMLRHLVAHAGEVHGRELQRYCSHIGFPALMLDRSDSDYMNLISEKVHIVESQARLILAQA